MYEQTKLSKKGTDASEANPRAKTCLSPFLAGLVQKRHGHNEHLDKKLQGFQEEYEAN